MQEEGLSMAEEIEWFVGIDWASQSHQVCLVGARGECLDERAVAHGGAGIPGEAGNEDRAHRNLHSRHRRLFCRAETEDGLYGWGEAYVTQGKEKVVAECIRTRAPPGIGRCAFNIRHTAIAEPSAHYRCDMTPRWRRESQANPSLDPNSLLAGKIQGISGIM